MYSRCSTSLSRTRWRRCAVLRTQPGRAIEHGLDQVKAIEVVQHRHVERRGGRALLLVAAHVQVVVVVAAIGEAMDQPGIAVEGEDDRLVGGEERVELRVAQAVRMLAWAAAASSGRRR